MAEIPIDLAGPGVLHLGIEQFQRNGHDEILDIGIITGQIYHHNAAEQAEQGGCAVGIALQHLELKQLVHGGIQRVVFLDGFIVGIHLIYLFKGWRGAVPGGRVGGFDAAALIGADDAAQQRGALLRPQPIDPGDDIRKGIGRVDGKLGLAAHALQ